jgi:hypothetical protein
MHTIREGVHLVSRCADKVLDAIGIVIDARCGAAPHQGRRHQIPARSLVLEEKYQLCLLDRLCAAGEAHHRLAPITTFEEDFRRHVPLKDTVTWRRYLTDPENWPCGPAREALDVQIIN